MPPPRKVDLLPAEVRQELDRRIVANAFSGYVALSDWLGELGFEISKSRIAEHGKGLEETLRAVSISTKAAQMVVEANPDDVDNRSAAVISLLQTRFFDLLVGMSTAEAEEDPAEQAKLLANVSKSFAHLSHASVAQKKWAMEVRGKIEATLARLEEKKPGKRALDVETLRVVREEIYGIV